MPQSQEEYSIVVGFQATVNNPQSFFNALLDKLLFSINVALAYT